MIPPRGPLRELALDLQNIIPKSQGFYEFV